MVLKAVALVALASSSWGCKQSLFDAHGDTDGGAGGDGAIALTCPGPCLGDAGGDFDGSPNGKTGRWRYLDDHRDRTWSAMLATGATFVGADPNNSFAACSGSSMEACKALPGALLVSAAGTVGNADPALEYTADQNEVIKIQLGVHPPANAVPETVRLYRNSREDVLFTGMAMAGQTLSDSITVDALAGDRFLVAVVPMGPGEPNVGLQMFVSGTGTSFPSECQVAIPFTAANGMTVDNVCGSDFTAKDDAAGAIPPTLGAGPYVEAGTAAQLVAGKYYDSVGSLDRTGDITVQMWLKHDMLVDSVTSAWAFSDYDLDQGGGVGIVIYDNAGTLTIESSTCTSPNPLAFDGVAAPYMTDKQWHFVRAVHHKDGMLELCIDGMRQGGKTLAGTLKSTYAPYIGRNVVWTPQGSFFNGEIDDVRVLTTALPCQ